jgi:hypothetical protein
MFLVFINIIRLGFYFYGINNPDLIRNNPNFDSYSLSPEVIRQSIILFCALIVFFIITALLRREAYKANNVLKYSFLSAVIVFVIAQWYGVYLNTNSPINERRLPFPVMSSLLITLTIWKTKFSDISDGNYIFKIIATIAINVGLYFLWDLWA